MKKLMIAILMIGMAVMLQAGKTDVLKKSFKVEPGKQAVINFTGVDGDVFVETHDKSEILFTFEKVMKGSDSDRNVEYFNKVKPEIDFSGNTLDIEIKYPKRGVGLFRTLSGFRMHVVSRLHVPVNSDLKFKVVDGDLEVSGANGAVVLRTVDGDLKVKACRGSLALHSVDGDVRIRDCEGTLDAKTVDGDMDASGVFSAFQFESVDGELDITLKPGSRLTADCKLRTVDGDIRLSFPRDFGFRLDWRGDDGDLETHGVEFQKVTRSKKHRFEGEHGDARHTIYVKCTDGDLELREN